MLGIGVGLNWLINWMLKALMAPSAIEGYLTQVVWAYVLAVGIAATLTSVKDIATLTIAGLRGSSSRPVEGTRDVE